MAKNNNYNNWNLHDAEIINLNYLYQKDNLEIIIVMPEAPNLEKVKLSAIKLGCQKKSNICLACGMPL